MRAIGSRVVLFFALPVVSAVLCSGCVNPDLVNTASGSLYPSAPGDEPFLLVKVVNDSTATLDVPIAYDDGTNPLPFLVRDLTPEANEVGVLLEWPVTRVAIADLNNPFTPGVIAALPDGTTVAIPSLQQALTAGVNYQRGDTIIYRFLSDSRNPAAISVAVGRIDGSTQTGPFSRRDTFTTVRQLLQTTGLTGGTQ
jgi:hypothetical protein